MQEWVSRQRGSLDAGDPEKRGDLLRLGTCRAVQTLSLSQVTADPMPPQFTFLPLVLSHLF